MLVDTSTLSLDWTTKHTFLALVELYHYCECYLRRRYNLAFPDLTAYSWLEMDLLDTGTSSKGW